MSAISAFVGNLPPNVTEQDLGQLFARHGAVSSVRLPRDSSGKSKPFGFVDLVDAASLQSVITALNGFEVLGHALRVESAGPKGGGGGVGGGSGSGGSARSGSKRSREPQHGGGSSNNSSMQNLFLMANDADPAAMSAQILSLNEDQLWEIVSQMKALVEQDAKQARAMLVSNPAVGLAVLKAQIRLGMVTQHSISSVLAAAQAQAQAQSMPSVGFRPAQPPPAHQQQTHPAPPPPLPSDPQAKLVAAAQHMGVDPAMLQQLLQLTDEQLGTIPDGQRAQVLALQQSLRAGT